VLGVQLAHTADLDADTLTAARGLLDRVFGADLSDDDWEHALGGVHALVWEQGALIGHASVIQRRLVYEDRALRTGYVECVAVRPDRRRRGVGAAMMGELERVIRAAYDLGALGATEDGAALYLSRGWRQWQGETWALTPSGPVRTKAEDGDVYVLQVGVELDLRAKLTCDWRDGDPW
jgi:aminoglycoside 2'-N-acetyltransferase I